MALQQAFLLPHSPLLIPEIGQANHVFLKKTSEAYALALEKLKDAQSETLIIITPHAQVADDCFSFNVAPEMNIELKDFGFIPQKNIFRGDAVLADELKSALRSDFPVQIISEAKLDYGSSVTLQLLKDFRPDFKVLILSPSKNSGPEGLLDFGRRLGQIVQESQKKISLIVSGDLSNRLKKKSPGGYSPKGAKFDNKLIEYLSENIGQAEKIATMDPKLTSGAGACAYQPLLIALGALSGNDIAPKVMSYQTDFGIGYLSLDFSIRKKAS